MNTIMQKHEKYRNVYKFHHDKTLLYDAFHCQWKLRFGLGEHTLHDWNIRIILGEIHP